jgi:hypothetical protein
MGQTGKERGVTGAKRLGEPSRQPGGAVQMVDQRMPIPLPVGTVRQSRPCRRAGTQ